MADMIREWPIKDVVPDLVKEFWKVTSREGQN